MRCPILGHPVLQLTECLSRGVDMTHAQVPDVDHRQALDSVPVSGPFTLAERAVEDRVVLGRDAAETVRSAFLHHKLWQMFTALRDSLYMLISMTFHVG